MYKASFDKNLLNDWREFCEGKKEFDKFHFSTLLMETFLEGYTDELDIFLKEITKYFDSSIYENLAYAFRNEQADKHDIQKWVAQDLKEKRKVIEYNPEAANILELIDNHHYSIVNDMQSLYEALKSRNHAIFYDEVGDYFAMHAEKDNRLYALQEVLYNIGSSYDLVYAILSGTLKGGIDFSNYLEIYRRGGNYAIGEENIIVYLAKS